MRRVGTPLILICVVAAGAVGGYWLGFRHAWEMGLMADAPVRGVIATQHLRMLEENNAADLRIAFEADVDSGLMWWAQLEDHPLYWIINTLSGHHVASDHERYVRRLAIYRKTHRSPLREPAVVENMLRAMQAQDSCVCSADRSKRASSRCGHRTYDPEVRSMRNV